MDLVASSVLSYGLDAAFAYSFEEYTFASTSAFIALTSVWYHSTKSKPAYYTDQLAIQVYIAQGVYESYFLHWLLLLLISSELMLCRYLFSYHQNHTHRLMHVTSALVHMGILLVKVYKV